MDYFFIKAIEKWLDRIDADCAIDEANLSCFNRDENTIYIGDCDADEAYEMFKQFMFEYGCDCTALENGTLSFLHELGHYATIDYFDDTDLMLCAMMKDEGDDYLTACNYWETLDELSANVWAMNFIQTFPQLTADLNEIFKGNF